MSMAMKLTTGKRIAETSSKGNQEKWREGGRWYKLDLFGYEGLAETVAPGCWSTPTWGSWAFLSFPTAWSSWKFTGASEPAAPARTSPGRRGHPHLAELFRKG